MQDDRFFTTKSSPSDEKKGSSIFNADKGASSLGAILKGAGLFAAAFFTAIIQTGFFLNFRPLDVAPDLCLALCVAVSIKYGAKNGALTGLFSGLCLDALSSVGISLLIPFYFAISIALGLWAEGKNTRGAATFAAAISVSSLLRISLIFFEVCLSSPSIDIGALAGKVLLPNLLITLLFSPVIYLAVFLYGKLLDKDDKTTRR